MARHRAGDSPRGLTDQELRNLVLGLAIVAMCLGGLALCLVTIIK